MKIGETIYMHPKIARLRLQHKPGEYLPNDFFYENSGMKLGVVLDFVDAWENVNGNAALRTYVKFKRDFYDAPLYVLPSSAVTEAGLSAKDLVANIVRNDQMTVIKFAEAKQKIDAIAAKKGSIPSALQETIRGLFERYNERQTGLKEKGFFSSVVEGFLSGYEWVKTTLGISGVKGIGWAWLIPLVKPIAIGAISLISVSVIGDWLRSAFGKSDADRAAAVIADKRLNDILASLPDADEQYVRDQFADGVENSGKDKLSTLGELKGLLETVGIIGAGAAALYFFNKYKK